MAREKIKERQERVAPITVKRKGIVPTRGRILQGFVRRRFPKRITVEFERTVYIPKYERFLKRTTRVHARIPENADVKVGDLVRVQECRPLSKITKFMFVEKIASAENSEVKKISEGKESTMDKEAK